MTGESKPFPAHGRVKCTLCFSTPGETASAGAWRFRNDPGHWGSSAPTILVLGFSKGATQVDAYDRVHFEEVAFAGCRARLKCVLVTLGLLRVDDDIDRKFRPDEKYFAFASLVRCSVARLDGRSSKPTTSGSIILKSFREPEPRYLLDNCSRQFLKHLPEKLRLVVMLGVQDGYVKECRRLIGSLYENQITDINAMSYTTG